MSRPSTPRSRKRRKVVDARRRAGHDGGEYCERRKGGEVRRSRTRAVGVGLLLVARDLCLLLLREPDIVERVEQAVLAEWIDVEPDDAAVRAADFLAFEIDGERGVRAAVGVIEQLLQILRRNAD